MDVQTTTALTTIQPERQSVSPIEPNRVVRFQSKRQMTQQPMVPLLNEDKRNDNDGPYGEGSRSYHKKGAHIDIYI